MTISSAVDSDCVNENVLFKVAYRENSSKIKQVCYHSFVLL